MRFKLDSLYKSLVAVLFSAMILITVNTQAQIYEPEGLNIPGSWNEWTNPPSNLSFAGSSQTSGGQVVIVPLTYPVYPDNLSCKPK